MLLCVSAGFLLRGFVGSGFNDASTEQGRFRETALLLVQQVDRLAMNYLETLTGEALPPREREGLATWIAFDRRFVELNRDDSSLAFEVATAMRRIGYANLLSGDLDQARDYLQQASGIFTSLENEFPTSISYRIDHAATRLQLAQLERLQNSRSAAIEECEKALQVLQIEQTLDSGEFEQSATQLINSAAKLLLALGQEQRARQLAEKNIAILERHTGGSSDSPQKAKLLDESRQILQSTSGAS